MKLLSKPTIIALIFLGILILKSGIAWWNWFALYPSLITTPIEPVDPFSANILSLLIAKFFLTFQISPYGAAWLIFNLIVTLLTLYYVVRQVYRLTWNHHTFPLYLSVFISLASSQLFFRELGRYDIFTLLGMSLFLFEKKFKTQFGGIALASVSSPEQTLVASLLFFSLTSIKRYKELRRKSLISMSISFTTIAVIYFWFYSYDSLSKTRIFGFLSNNVLNQELDPIASGNQKTDVYSQILFGAVHLPLFIFGTLGIAIYFLIRDINLIPNTKDKISLVFIAFIAPYIIALTFGSDLTRDYAVLSYLVIQTIFIKECREEKQNSLVKMYLQHKVSLTLAIICFPTIYIFWNKIERPWSFFISFIDYKFFGGVWCETGCFR